MWLRVQRFAELAACKTLESLRIAKQRVDAALLSISVGGRRTVYIISHEPSFSHQFER